MPPAVSVVMAARNYARYLPQAVESVLAQTVRDWDLVVVDDGSTDGTPEAVRPFLRDPRVRCVRTDRLGQSRAKNLGVALTEGPLVAFLDADDAWRPTKLEKQLARFEGRPEVGVVFCLRSLIDGDGGPLPACPLAPPPRGRVQSHLFRNNFVCFSSAVVRREALSRAGRFDPSWDLAIDFDLWLRVARHCEFDCVDEALVLYRTGHGNLSQKLSDRVATALSMMDRAVSRHGAGEGTSAAARADGYSSTCRTMAYVIRASEPVAAMAWYAKALRWPGGRRAAAKGMAAAALAYVRGRRLPGSAENATANA